MSSEGEKDKLRQLRQLRQLRRQLKSIGCPGLITRPLSGAILSGGSDKICLNKCGDETFSRCPIQKGITDTQVARRQAVEDARFAKTQVPQGTEILGAKKGSLPQRK